MVYFSASSSIWFCRCKVPVWMKWRIACIYLEMKMGCCGYTWHSNPPDHISFSNFCSFFYEYFREMKVSGINSCFYTINHHSIMSYDDKPISGTICFDSSYYNSICNSKNRCTDRGTNIDTEMSSDIFPIVELIISHIWCYISIMEDCGSLFWIICVKKSNRIIEWNLKVFAYRDIFKTFTFILICTLCPIWNIRNRHNSTIKWIGYYFCIRICPRFHIGYPDLLDSYSYSKNAVTRPYYHDWSGEPERRVKHRYLYLFFNFDISISYYFYIGKYWI